MESTTTSVRRHTAAHPADGPALPPLPARRPVLLVVDDDEPLREALRLIFEYQYEIVLAGSGPEALSSIQRGHIEVAIVDLRMPGMSGFEFLERSRAMDPDIQTVILSGQSTFEMARQAVRLAAFDFLPKPFDLHQLRQTIQQAARRRAWLRFERQREAALHRAVSDTETAAQERDLLASLLAEFQAPLTAVANSAAALEQQMSKHPAPAEPQLRAWHGQLQELARQAALCVELSGRSRPDSAVAGPIGGVLAGQVLADLERLLRVQPAAKSHQLTVRPAAAKSAWGSPWCATSSSPTLAPSSCAPCPAKARPSRSTSPPAACRTRSEVEGSADGLVRVVDGAPVSNWPECPPAKGRLEAGAPARRAAALPPSLVVRPSNSSSDSQRSRTRDERRTSRENLRLVSAGRAGRLPALLSPRHLTVCP